MTAWVLVSWGNGEIHFGWPLVGLIVLIGIIWIEEDKP